MTPTERIQQVADEAIRRILEIEEEAKKKEQWPKVGCEYFTIGGNGKVFEQVWSDSAEDRDRLANFNVFKTTQDAELARDYRVADAKWATGLGWHEDTYKLISSYRKMMIDTFGKK